MEPIVAPPQDRSKAWFVQSRLRELVSTLDTGARLPAERELALEWSVARMTLRKGIDALVDEGKLERRPGSGTYVVQRPTVRTLGLSSFSEDMIARGQVPGTLTIDLHREPATAAVAETLQIEPGDPIVVFTRLRLADQEPVAVETTWMPEALVPGLRLDDLDGSLYDRLRDRHGLVPKRASTVIGAGRASARDAILLDVAAGDPVLLITMVDFADDRTPFMFAVCSYRPDRYQLHAELTHHPRSGSAH